MYIALKDCLWVAFVAKKKEICFETLFTNITADYCAWLCRGAASACASPKPTGVKCQAEAVAALRPQCFAQRQLTSLSLE